MVSTLQQSAAEPESDKQVKKLPFNERDVEYIPLGEKDAVKLSMKMVRDWIAVPTKSGKLPTDSDLMKFIMLCKARELNPWVGDAYLIGYDSYDANQPPSFQLITSVQALFKRADMNPEYDGFESGVIVLTKGGEVEERIGGFRLDGETLVGGWCRVYRKDHGRPTTMRVRLATFFKDNKIWKNDPEGMITKCAEAASLRKAFPNQLTGLYLREEMEPNNTIDARPVVDREMDDLAGSLGKKRAAITHQAQPATLTPQADTRDPEPAAIDATYPKEETKQVVDASESQEELDVFTDFKRQIESLQSEEEGKALALTIRRSQSLTDEQRRYLQRLVAEKSSSLG